MTMEPTHWMTLNCHGSCVCHSKSVHVHQGRTKTRVDPVTGERYASYWLVYDGILADPREVKLNLDNNTFVELPMHDDLEVYLIPTTICVQQYKELARHCATLCAVPMAVLAAACVGFYVGRM